jgi:small subunit ribosomal protein S6
MRPYEVMAIFEATTEPGLIQGVVDRALELIRNTGGTPGGIERWGKRSFAYEVNHKREGYYLVIEFVSEPETVSALDRMLGLADEVVRHKVVRLPDTRLPAASPPAATTGTLAGAGTGGASATAGATATTEPSAS